MSLRLLTFATLVVVWLVNPSVAQQPTWKAGTAAAIITPKQPMAMAGYAFRKKDPSQGTEQDLFAKALAIEDGDGNRVLFITLDLAAVSRQLRTQVTAELERRHKLSPANVVLNASHTHCGPSYYGAEAKAYFETLVGTLVEVSGRALKALQPAHLNYSQARCGFAMNRRTPTLTGYQNHPNPEGPVDHSVPVLSVLDASGKLRAVMFGYACHNTTMSFNKWYGDYAGCAQEYFEKDHPGVTAMFFMGCGGDQNPYPRRELKYAQQNGRALATAVEAALEMDQSTKRHQRTLKGPVKSLFETVKLEYTDNREQLDYPIQLVQFGNDLTIVALSSETVVDYSLRLKRELADAKGPRIWIGGYSNAIDGYIPSRRVLLEGGYEAESRPWKPSLEERIVTQVQSMYKKLNP